jgi:hypothetical protein
MEGRIVAMLEEAGTAKPEIRNDQQLCYYLADRWRCYRLLDGRLTR